MSQKTVDEIIREVEEEIAEREAEADVMRHQLEDYQNQTDMRRGALYYLKEKAAEKTAPKTADAGPEQQTPSQPPPSDLPSNGRVPECGRFNRMSRSVAAATILRENGGPMRVGDIVQLMIDDGVDIDRQNLMATITTAMSRDEGRFRRVERGTWALQPPGVQPLPERHGPQ